MNALEHDTRPINHTIPQLGSESAPPLDDLLFHALHAMATKSPRFQADVHAAMRCANISASSISVATALERLAVAGRVSNLIPLRDGGLLVTVAV